RLGHQGRLRPVRMGGDRMTRLLSDVQLKLEDTPPCPRCGGSTLLLARFPHSWTNRVGDDVPGLREALLCPSCDHTDPACRPLLALFAVDEQIDPANLAAFAGL